MCSTIILEDLSALRKPYSVSSLSADSRVDAASFEKFAWKFMYPAPAASTWSMRLVFGFPIALITSFTSSRGFLCSCFANSKHIEEASWPYSGFDGFSKAKLAVEASGRVFFKAFAKIFSHSWRNSANGFADTIAFFASGVVAVF